MSSQRHARLGPSSSDIWLNCTGAPAMWATRPPRKVGFAAHEGVLAHTLCEAALTIHAVPWKEGATFDVDGDSIQVTPEMLNAVQLFAATTGSISDASQWRVVEGEVSLAWIWTLLGEEPPENVFGTSDFGACDGFTLYVLDFKFGRGKGVRVDRNTQLLLYALGLYGKLVRERPDLAQTIENVCLVIVQPRAGGQPVRTWTISLGDLLYWGYSTFKPSVEIIANGGGPLVPGNHCFFCAASIDCPVYARYRTQRSIDSFPDYDPELDAELETI
jgi:hypothetical protein